MPPSLPILDRLQPTDWRHVQKYPLRAIQPVAVSIAEHTIALPDYRVYMDQGIEGACVGFGESWCLSALRWRRFDAAWLYHECKKRDGYPDLQGTWLQYGFDVMRDEGHRAFFHNIEREPQLVQGILANRWCADVDDVRTTLANDSPVALGIDWMTNYDTPILKNGEYWIGLGDVGTVRGGHCICAYRVSDERQAVRLCNSWGMNYPIVWLPYAELDRQLRGGGEAGTVTPR